MSTEGGSGTKRTSESDLTGTPDSQKPSPKMGRKTPPKKGKVITSTEEARAFVMAPEQPNEKCYVERDGSVRKHTQNEADFITLDASMWLGEIESIVEHDFKKIEEWLPSLTKWLGRKVPESRTDYAKYLVRTAPADGAFGIYRFDIVPYSSRLEPLAEALRRANGVLHAHQAFRVVHAQYEKAGNDLLKAHQEFEALDLDVKAFFRRRKTAEQLWKAYAYEAMTDVVGFASPNRIKALIQGQFTNRFDVGDDAQVLANRRMEAMKASLRQLRRGGLGNLLRKIIVKRQDGMSGTTKAGSSIQPEARSGAPIRVEPDLTSPADQLVGGGNGTRY
jgi:hypothetical protein